MEATNGLGNLIVGYNEMAYGPLGEPAPRSGSHNVVIGWGHAYLGCGGLVAGARNTILGNYTSVTGGRDNNAHGHCSTVSGGQNNLVGHTYGAVSGGRGRRTFSEHDWVGGSYVADN